MGINVKELVAKAAKLDDQTKTSNTGDFEYTPPAKGTTLGRFIEYIELGLQPQKPYQGKPRKDVEQVRVTFELLQKKNIREIEKDDGTTIKVADRISITLSKSYHVKAGYKKLFDKMTYGRSDITHMAQMLGEGFMLKIHHNESEKDGTKRIFAGIKDSDGSFSIGEAVIEDVENNTTRKAKVPDAISPVRLFLWNTPTRECWDSLFIDGEREEKDDRGNVKTVSKNWLQNLILKAKNFKGSPLEEMLEGADELNIDSEDSVDELEEELTDEVEYTLDEEVEEKPVAKKAPAKAVKEPTKKQTKKATQVEADEDDLKSLGLI